MASQVETRNIRQIQERAMDVRDGAGELAKKVRVLRRDLEKTVRGQLEERPYQTLGAAAAVGFVLGGGLSLMVLRTLMRFGTRAAVAAVVERYLNGEAEE